MLYKYTDCYVWVCAGFGDEIAPTCGRVGGSSHKQVNAAIALSKVVEGMGIMANGNGIDIKYFDLQFACFGSGEHQHPKLLFPYFLTANDNP